MRDLPLVSEVYAMLLFLYLFYRMHLKKVSYCRQKSSSWKKIFLRGGAKSRKYAAVDHININIYDALPDLVSLIEYCF